MTTTHTIDVEAERQMRADYAQWKDANNVTGGDGLLLRLFSAGWLAAKRSIQPTIAAEDVRDAAYADAEEACCELLHSGADFRPTVYGCIAAIRARRLATPTPPSKG